MKGRVLVFIDGVHGRRSSTSIQGTNHSTSDTCHRLKCLCSLSDLYRPDDVMLHKPPSKGPCHHQLLSSDRQLLSSDRHHIDYVTNHSVFTVTILALLCHHSCMSIRRPMNIDPSWLYWPSPQLTVCTKATDQMGWRGQLKRIKIGDKAWRVQRVHVHGPKEGRAHSLCGIPDETKT